MLNIFIEIFQKIEKKIIIIKLGNIWNWAHRCVCRTCQISMVRSSHQTCTMKKVVRRNFAKFTGKHLCQSLFFKRPATLLKKRLWHACIFIEKETLAQVFSCEFCEISKNTFFTEHLWTDASIWLDIWECPKYTSDLVISNKHLPFCF